jgi:hypothetical protein
MVTKLLADNQPIDSRFGDAVWLTSFITPDNPDVRLAHDRIVANIDSLTDRITALWRFVSKIPYRETIGASMNAGGRSLSQPDTWFYPSEEMQVGVGNCANKSFLLTSLLKNELPAPGQVYCVFGELRSNGAVLGNHAWVEALVNGRNNIIETTIGDLSRAMIPAPSLDMYIPKIYFDEGRVYTADIQNTTDILNRRYGVRAIQFLHDYLCEKCLALEE